MKYSLYLLSALGAITSATPCPRQTSSNPSTDGLSFVIDGETRYFAGSNAYWLPFLTNNADVDLALDHIAESGLTILRTWGFNDVNTVPANGTVYFQSHANGVSTINTGQYGLERLDYVVSAAEQRGIKLIIPFVNNWDDYGGMDAYVNTYGGDKIGWYTNPDIQNAYQAYVEAVVSRYVDSTGIFAWELANEPRCSQCETSVINEWATETSAFIKSIDHNHLVAIGDEGMGLDGGSDYPYTSYEGNDFALNLAIPDIDFGTFHLYTADWGVTNNTWGNQWIQDHAAVCESLGKPCLFEEYGIKDAHCTDELVWQATSLATTGMAADLFWQVGDTLSGGQTANDHYTVYYGSSDWTCVVTDHVADITGA
ncbi:glycoside hydrolase superfamily [Aspergillus cavernicola]|uniref:mannan endo-1,4-beta-mannosidase n=1 Tax=Aspergillus cavernicola TaxID=176166 RepID=A0ABR4I267_9EURO